MKRHHKFVILFEPWTNEYTAYSDSIGIECSPVGVAESPVAALELLIDELEELEKRSEP